MRLGHVELFVANPMASKTFYCDVLGFTLDEVQGESHVWLSLGSCQLLLRPNRQAGAPENYQAAASALVLYTEDLETSRRELESRGLQFRGVDGSENCLTFRDPDGNWFQLVNPDGH